MSEDEDPFEHLEESDDEADDDPFDKLRDAVDSDVGPGDSRPGREEGERRDPDDEGPLDVGRQPDHEAGSEHGPSRDDGPDETEGRDLGAAGPGDGVDPDDAGTVPTRDPFDGEWPDRGDPFEDSAFERRNAGDVDPDDVWQSLTDAREQGTVTRRNERTYAEVSKHSYCEQCEYFSEPPDVQCLHEGTTILEFVDHETVRLVDCPVVAERKELQRHE